MLADHLTGGVHVSPSRTVHEQTKSVPKTNRVSEKDFAQLDRLLREKPNAALIGLEGSILFPNNKTQEWLNGKKCAESEKIFLVAR